MFFDELLWQVTIVSTLLSLIFNVVGTEALSNFVSFFSLSLFLGLLAVATCF